MIGLPVDMDGVIKRWYPAGVDVVAAGRASEPVGVFVMGTSGSGVDSVTAEIDAMAGFDVPRALSAESAAVVLFVVDASAPLGRRALTDLAPVLESTTVGVVINKIDVHRGWRDIEHMAAESIAEFVPRSVDVSFWPTSAKLAERARVAVDPVMAETLRKESGIAEVLGFVLDTTAVPRRLLAEHKYNAAVRAAAAGARREIVSKARTVTDASVTSGLRAERARLAELRDRSRAERAAALRNRLALARAESLQDVAESTREFASTARASIDTAGRAELRHITAELGVRLGSVAHRIDTALDDRLRAIDTELELSAELPSEPAFVIDTSGPPVRSRGIEDKMMIVLGASAGVGLGRVVVAPLSMVPALDIAVVPVSLLVGALCAWWLVGSRRLVADRAHVRIWVSEATGAARASLEQGALARILGAETALGVAAHETSKSAVSAAENDLERVEAELRAAAERRAAVLAACDRDLVTLDRGVAKFGVPVRVEPARVAPRLNDRGAMVRATNDVDENLNEGRALDGLR